MAARQEHYRRTGNHEAPQTCLPTPHARAAQAASTPGTRPGQAQERRARPQRAPPLAEPKASGEATRTPAPEEARCPPHQDAGAPARPDPTEKAEAAHDPSRSQETPHYEASH